jgi:hypothetical protein
MGAPMEPYGFMNKMCRRNGPMGPRLGRLHFECPPPGNAGLKNGKEMLINQLITSRSGKKWLIMGKSGRDLLITIQEWEKVVNHGKKWERFANHVPEVGKSG